MNILKIYVGLMLCLIFSIGTQAKEYNILDFRANPDGHTINTKAIQLAIDIKTVNWDRSENILSGISWAVGGDPYQLRIYIPDGFMFSRVELPAGLIATTALSDEPNGNGKLLTVDYTTFVEEDVLWKICFKQKGISVH